MADEIPIWDRGADAGWATDAGDGCQAAFRVEPGTRGPSLRFDFALAGHGSWAIARREIACIMPPHYVVELVLRGTGAVHELQVKLVDPSGANVWWWRRAGFAVADTPARLVLRKATLDFAWGPASGGDPDCVGAVEVAVASNTPVAGTLWVDVLRVVPRPVPTGPPRVEAVRTSSAASTAAWLELDLGQATEWGGVIIDVDGAAPAMRLAASEDGTSWTPIVEIAAGATGPQWLRSADGDGRFARIEFLGTVPVVRSVKIVPLELAVSPGRWAMARARQAPRGRYPRHLLDEQAYWAVVAADADPHKALLGEHGALEIDLEQCTIEPFLQLDGRLVTWADVEHDVTLADGYLPIPSVSWRIDPTLDLTVTAFSTGDAGRSTLVGRYAISSRDSRPRSVRLVLAIRPYQVTPLWQRLNVAGGVAPLRTIVRDDRALRVNGDRPIVAVSPPDAFGAAPTDAGLEALWRGEMPDASAVDDPLGFAEAAFAFDAIIAPGSATTFAIAVPHEPESPRPPPSCDARAAAAWADTRLDEAVGWWRGRLARIPIALPASAVAFDQSLRASIGWVLVNRDGPRIQPGPRCYRRSWIRDGALTGTALAEMGFADEARAFFHWYAPHQLEDGRVPCAVDHNGIDPVPEHDSHGELIWGIGETHRLTGDRAFLAALWPHMRRAADAIAALRAQRTTLPYRDRACFGLLPESISHEGYASRPVHAFWDDFFAVLGLREATEAALIVGDTAAAPRIAALHDAMQHDLHAAIRRTIAEHRLDVIPGSVELGDFDPTSTAIVFDPCDEWRNLPERELRVTFDRYWDEFEARRTGIRAADAYTPYEIRTATALVRLGRLDRAVAMLDWLLGDQRPTAWRQWPEIAWRDARAPRFLGDLPHGWVASSFVRAVRRMVVYEERDTGTLVLGAGVPAGWVREAPGVGIVRLPTRWGHLSGTLYAPSPTRMVVSLESPPPSPPGGIRICSPLAGPIRAATADGIPVAEARDRSILVRGAAQTIVVEH